MSQAPLILVVEDNEVNQLLTASVLEREGFAVDLAANSEQAMERLRARTPDLILMDVQLPGMDGLSLTRKLKADPAMARIAIVALTAHAMTGDREQTLAAGCAGYIAKPIDTRSFGRQVRDFLPPTTPAVGRARTDARLNGQ
ncbi:MAG TPA: response regulator [Candidatus Dormibacteraeota bacterium]